MRVSIDKFDDSSYNTGMPDGVPASSAAPVPTPEPTVFNNPTQAPTAAPVIEPITDGWQEITPTSNKTLWWENGSYTYTFEDGTKFEVKDTQDVEVKYNPNTGQIVISGAKDGSLTCGNKGSVVSIYNSTINNVKGGSKDDVIGIYGSTVTGNVDGADGNDRITINNSKVLGQIAGGAYLGWGGAVLDDDIINILNDSTVQDICAGSGADKINVVNSKVLGKLDGNGGNDTISTNNAQIKEVVGGMGDDKFSFKDTTIDGKVLTGANVWQIFDFLNGDDTVNVINSVADEIKTGAGDDKVTFSNSTANSVDTGNGIDNVVISDQSVVNDVKTGKGDDNVAISNSKAGEVDTGKGDDTVTTVNSSVDKITTGKGDDKIAVTDNSEVGEINSGNGDDNIVISKSKAGKVDSGSGDDIINITDSTITTLDTSYGNDNVVIENSQIETIDALQGKNNIAIDENSTVDMLKSNADTKAEIIQDFGFEVENLDTASIETALDVIDTKANEYTDRILTPEEQYQVLAMDILVQNLDNMMVKFDEQNSSDGVVNNGYNIAKQLLDLGVSKEDIDKAIAEQQQMIDELKAAFNNEGNETFEEVFERWTGVKYDKDNMSEYLENAQMYSFALNGLAKTDTFTQGLLEAQNLDDALQLFTNYYGSEDRGRDELNKLLQETILAHPEEFFTVSIEINDQNQLVRVMSDSMDMMGNYPEDSLYTECVDITDIANVIRTMPRNFDLNQYSENFKNQLQNTIGCSFEALQNNYISSQLETFGNQSSFQKLIDEYCADQEGFKDKLATCTQLGGLCLTGVGAIATFVSPPVGIAMMEVGHKAALLGMFGDNVLDIVDGATSENGLSEDEYMGIIGETLTEIALLYSGAKINGVSSSVKDVVLTETQSKLLAKLAEIGTDASLSLLTDLVITGDIDLTSEGVSQLLGILTGSAGAKINEYKAKTLADAGKLYADGDIDSAFDSLKEAGFDDKQIAAFTSAMESGRSLSYTDIQRPLNANRSSYDNLEDTQFGKIYDDISRNVDSIEDGFKGLSEAELKERLISAGIKEEFVANVMEGTFNAQNSAAVVMLKFILPPDTSDISLLTLAANLDSAGLSKVKFLTDQGLDVHDIFNCVSRFGQNLDTLTPDRIEAMSSLNKTELNNLFRVSNHDIFISDLIGMPELYEKYNYILNGECLDTKLADSVSEIGNRFGIEIKLDNDAISKDYTGDTPSSKIITQQYLDEITRALEIMQAQGMKLPQNIYLTEFLSTRAAGGFSGYYSDTVVMKPDTSTPASVLIHEASHLNDWVPGANGGEYNSTIKAQAIGVDPDNFKTLSLRCSNGTPVSQEDITNCISTYSTTNCREFVAEIGVLVNSGIIAKTPDGTYNIVNNAQIPPDYCTGWTGSKEDIMKLNAIMEFYEFLIS